MKILITTSTFPATDDDPVPSFVKDQAIHFKKCNKNPTILVHTPHNAYSKTYKLKPKNTEYTERRFYYFWPFRFQLLTGRSILPALKKNRLLYLQIPFLFVFHFFSLLRLTIKEKPDILYAHWFTPQAINSSIVSIITRTPFIFTTHASDVSILHKVPFSKQIVKFVCGQASEYTAVSKRTAKKLINFFDKEDWENDFQHKLSIIPMGVNANFETPSEKVVQTVSDKYNLSDESKEKILFIGRLAEKKGVTYLLEALSILSKRDRSKVQVIIAGSGQLEAKLKQLVNQKKLTNVIFTGYIQGKEKDALLSLADFVILPSIIDAQGDSEGFPVVLMEALAAGKIVLASNVTGAEDILDETTGFIFEQKSASAIAEQLTKAMRLSSDKINTMTVNSAKIAQQYDWSVITEKHYKLINKSLNENSNTQ